MNPISFDVTESFGNVTFDVDGNNAIPFSSGITYTSNTSVIIDTTSNWNRKTTFVPKRGDIIVYSDYSEYEKDGEIVKVPNFKIGDGMAYCVDLPFVGEDTRDMLVGHISNGEIHITNAERIFWNNKVTVDDALINEETLILTRN